MMIKAACFKLYYRKWGGVMNITLSADAKLVRATRRYADRHNTSLNNLLRQYMQTIGGDDKFHAQRAEEFKRLATEHAGRSEQGFVFDREDIHRR